MATKEETLKAMIAPVVEALGCEFWGLEYLSSGRSALLRIYIDRAEEGVTVEDCEKVSRQVSSLMDVEDPISGEYTLEVSSPGLERPLYNLEQFQRYVGEEVALKLRFPYEGRRKFKGRLNGVEGEDILLVVDDHEYLFPVDSVEKANVVPRF
ncbi:ribosome maturation factor RimP [Porticoccus litoralis]|uniref:Ribosome maturation factor RimP n=1 Tax=Porticoccus litoralis TaxID=434086 RepID=A0AAW8B8C0_9GAMM|nr:ribosome maturation factor RimP [Porticoccus litoralis]MDP1521396.1 ribosome maturation factor RimP [Porticoccus litoralis]